MTVNERLFEANILEEYDRAVAADDEAALTEILAKIDIRRDENGMNWPINAQD